ncbi:MAG: TauD/TfdA family dioxygenase [Rhizobiales bacterium]|nr:TauD/TfdA family dioxygenase [Hyphomicrobiales bacterium]
MNLTNLSPSASRASISDDVRTRSLSPAIGAEIIGVDLSKPISDQLFAKILDIWHRSLVVLLRDQHLTEDDQVRFGERFGPPAISHTQRFTTKNPAVMLISNVRENGELIGALPDGEMHFHSDQCHQERPATASMLYSLEVPSQGGNTLFANAYLAYETLPNLIKTKIDGRKALNAYDYDNASTRRGTRLREGIPSCWHPVVRTHPATGKKALYVNRLMTIAIEGMSDSESEELLNTLFDHQEQPEFIYEHVWRAYDVLLWDNRCALHARTDFSAEERRLMRRLTILGERPF